MSTLAQCVQTTPGELMEKMENNQTPWQPTTTMVYACSGCSDAGELADRVARQLTREGVAQMSCLAGIGGGVKNLVAKARSAERILVIDGCPLSCARHTFQRAGFTEFEHLGLQTLGLRKGACEVTDTNITAGVAAAKQLILNPIKG